MRRTAVECFGNLKRKQFLTDAVFAGEKHRAGTTAGFQGAFQKFLDALVASQMIKHMVPIGAGSADILSAFTSTVCRQDVCAPSPDGRATAPGFSTCGPGFLETARDFLYAFVRHLSGLIRVHNLHAFRFGASNVEIGVAHALVEFGRLSVQAIALVFSVDAPARAGSGIGDRKIEEQSQIRLESFRGQLNNFCNQLAAKSRAPRPDKRR